MSSGSTKDETTQATAHRPVYHGRSRHSASHSQSAAAKPAAAMDEVSLLDIGRVLWRRKALLLTIPTLAVALTGGLGTLVPKVYEARAVLMFDPPRASELTAMRDIDEATVKSEVELLRSRRIATAVVEQLDLDTNEAFLLEGTRGLLSLARNQVRAWIAPALADGARQPPSVDPVERVRAGLQVEQQGKSQVIAVGYRGADPERAALIANAVVESYLAEQRTRRDEFDHRIDGWLDERVRESRLRLDAARDQLDAYLATRGDARAGGAGAMANQIAGLESDLLDAQLERRTAEARVSRLRTVALSELPTEAAAFSASPALAQLDILKDSTSRKRSELEATFGSRHPRILEVNREIDAIDQRIAEERGKLVQGFQAELAGARAREAAIASELERVKGVANQSQATDSMLEKQQREVDIAGRIHATFLERAEGRADVDGLRHAEARLISEAVPPGTASFPDSRVIFTVTLTVSLVIALLAVYLAELAERGFRTNDEVEGTLGLPSLGLLPKLRRRKSDPSPEDYVVAKPNSRFGECLRGVIATLEGRLTRAASRGLGANRESEGDPAFEAQGADDGAREPGLGQVLMINSTLPGEGKTTVALSLARLAAQEGLRTLLIDADFRHPSLARLLNNGRPMAGFAEVLRGELSLYDAVRPDPLTPMWFLAGNERVTQPTRLLGAGGIASLVEEARATCDLVIIDTAPLLAVSDAKLIAPFCDWILFVTRWQDTARSLASDSVRALRDSGTPILGVVLNQVDLRRLANYGNAASAIASARLQAYYAD